MVTGMILSKCCKQDVGVKCVNDYGMYYVCKRCEMECDTITAFELAFKDEPLHAEI